MASSGTAALIVVPATLVSMLVDERLGKGWNIPEMSPATEVTAMPETKVRNDPAGTASSAVKDTVSPSAAVGVSAVKPGKAVNGSAKFFGGRLTMKALARVKTAVGLNGYRFCQRKYHMIQLAVLTVSNGFAIGTKPRLARWYEVWSDSTSRMVAATVK